MFVEIPALDLHSFTIAVTGCDRRIVAQAILLPRICGALSSSITMDLANIVYCFVLSKAESNQLNSELKSIK